MKKLLLVLLFSFILCQKETPNTFFSSTFNSIKCVLKSDILMNSFSKILTEYNTNGLTNIFTVFYSVFLDLKNEFIKCSEQLNKVNETDENEDDMDIKLGYPRAVLVLYTILGQDAFDWYDQGGYELLQSNCFKYKGQKEWYCNFIRKPK